MFAFIRKLVNCIRGEKAPEVEIPEIKTSGRITEHILICKACGTISRFPDIDEDRQCTKCAEWIFKNE